jgi:DNA-binding transcriptional MerR regulator
LNSYPSPEAGKGGNIIFAMPELKAPEIPDRLYFRIGDVSELLGVEPFVLRFWETEFPQLRPRKGSTGHREYKRKDVVLLLEIKRLLYDEGFTISGARKALKERGRVHRKKPPAAGQAQMSLISNSSHLQPKLDEIKKEIREILGMLKRAR